MSELLLEGRGLTRYYSTNAEQTLTACRQVDLALWKGETLGIVGESGCGKSTLLRLLAQLEQPDEGRLLFHGRDITRFKGEKLRRHRQHIQMVFQNPAASFLPHMQAADAVSEPIRNFQRLSRTDLEKKVATLLALVELPTDFAKRYPHSMSGGQLQRLAIARALALEPEILICDEATASLDASIQLQIVQLLANIQRQRQLSMVFVCHDLALVQAVSHRVMVMYLGSVVEVLPGNQVWDQACHPYSRELIQSVFTLDMDFSQPIPPMEGGISSSLDLPQGCSFSTRCPHCINLCRRERPVLRAVGPNHQVACHLLDSTPLQMGVD